MMSEVSKDFGLNLNLIAIRPKRLSLSQQVPVAFQCFEWTGKEMSLQWKNPSNQPWYIFTSGVFNQR